MQELCIHCDWARCVYGDSRTCECPWEPHMIDGYCAWYIPKAKEW